MSGYDVVILRPGYSTPLGPAQQRAEGTVTLVKGPKHILVDTGGPWSGQRLLESLGKEGVSAAEIEFVVCTHGHSDHTGNNNLFPNAMFIVCYDVCKGDLYTVHDFRQPYIIDENVRVIATPGHTSEDVSVIVQANDGVYAITGDLFECADDLGDENLWLSSSGNPETQRENREKILRLADYIVPGHGDVFAGPGPQEAWRS